MKRGRPPLDPDDRSVKISFCLPSRAFDALCHQARVEAVSMPALMRRLLQPKLRELNTKK